MLRVDSAGASHELLDWCRDGAVRYSVGYDLTETVRQAILQIPDEGWVCALDQDGGERANGHVAEITGLLDLTGWPAGSRVLVRRERAHPGAQLSFTDHDGHRFQAILTDQPGDVADVERHHRARARVEDHIRNDKDTGLRNMPFRDFEHNRVWLQLVLIAHDLLCWTQRLLLKASSRAPNPSACATGCCTSRPAWRSGPPRRDCASKRPGPGRPTSPTRSRASRRSPRHPANAPRRRSSMTTPRPGARAPRSLLRTAASRPTTPLIQHQRWPALTPPADPGPPAHHQATNAHTTPLRERSGLRRCRRGARLATTHGSATWLDALRPVQRHNEGARELPIGWRSSTIAVALRQKEHSSGRAPTSRGGALQPPIATRPTSHRRGRLRADRWAGRASGRRVPRLPRCDSDGA